MRRRPGRKYTLNSWRSPCLTVPLSTVCNQCSDPTLAQMGNVFFYSSLASERSWKLELVTTCIWVEKSTPGCFVRAGGWV
jgi:hypothetical protein